MIIHANIAQGSEEWLDLRANHPTASEAPVMMGASSKMKRNELLAMKATGVAREVSDYVQRMLFDKGHEQEAMARPIIEAKIGEELFPVTATDDQDWLLASFDGMTMMEDTLFEHKMWNLALAEAVRNEDLPAEYYWQLEQQLLVSKAERVIFVCSDGTEENLVWMEYRAVKGRAKLLVDSWKQFEADLLTYTPPAPKIEVVGVAPDQLPALSIELTGMVTASNLEQFKQHALKTIGKINRNLITDQDFANAEKTVKWCQEVEDKTRQAKQDALDKTATIAELFSALDEISETARSTRLALDKLVKAQKESRRKEIIGGAQTGFDQHIAAINAGFGGRIFLPQVTIDLATAVKGKRSLESIQNAVDTEVARGKVEATTLGESISANLVSLRELAGQHGRLFADAQQLVTMPNTELVELITARIEEAERAETARIAEIERVAVANALAKKAEDDRIEAARLKKIADDAEAKRLADEKAVENKRLADEAAVAKAAEPAPAAKVEPTPAPVAKSVTAPAANKVDAPTALVGDFFGNAPETSPVAAAPIKAPCEPEMVTIPHDLYDELLADQVLLRALEAAGVDNWSGWDVALETLRKQAA
ncbi:YqaJ viral recombinase family protein [Pseudomonas sp. UMAB-08]|uniref:YqaJ viral recombinase family protein n=1 Tax=Pseudomonas sp. UMAB-08 TaxID=1365375 RepID=UPI001C58FFD6|nr:YqaJ viral recombinase family protein [Pseudomonas sp. UMAB-08]